MSHNDDQLALVSVDEVKTQGHSHQNNFVFVFAGHNFDKVVNTIMFNIYDKQENYHEVIINKEYQEFVTTNENNSFKIKGKNDLESHHGNDTIVLFMVVVFSLIVTFIFVKMERKLSLS